MIAESFSRSTTGGTSNGKFCSSSNGSTHGDGVDGSGSCVGSSGFSNSRDGFGSGVSCLRGNDSGF